MLERARAAEVDRDGERENCERPHRRPNGDRCDEDAHDRFDHDPDAGGTHEKGFGEGGEGFYAGVTVGVVLIGRLVRDADREESQRGAQQIETGVRRIGEHAEAAGQQAGNQLQRRHAACSEHGYQGGDSLLLHEDLDGLCGTYRLVRRGHAPAYTPPPPPGQRPGRPRVYRLLAV